MKHRIYAGKKREYVGYLALDKDGTPYTHEVQLGDTCEYHFPCGTEMSLLVVTTNKHTCEDCSLDANNLCPRGEDGACVLYTADKEPRLAFKCIDSILEGL